MAIAMPAVIAEIGANVPNTEQNDQHIIGTSFIANGQSLAVAAYAVGSLVEPIFADLNNLTNGDVVPGTPECIDGSRSPALSWGRYLEN